MMKGRTWTPAALKEVGGTEGIGGTFLEETFSSTTAPPEHRYHQKAARAVLKALLPESGSDIKGNMRSSQVLMEASGYQGRPRDFEDLIGILDGKVRLITPTDPEGAPDDEANTPGGTRGSAMSPLPSRYYQLTHDYLVPSLRDWLTRKQKETRRGRAELRLAERAAVWNAMPQRRHLPSPIEYVAIRLLTDKKKWTEPQQKMIRRASWEYGRRLALIAVALSAICYQMVEHERLTREREQEKSADALVQSLLAANTADVGSLLPELDKYRQWTIPLLTKAVENKESTRKQKLHASLALLKDDPSQVDFVAQRLLDAPAEDLPLMISLLQPHKAQLEPGLWQTVKTGTSGARLRAAAALAGFDPQSAQWTEYAPDVAVGLVSVPQSESKLWIGLLQPVGAQLVQPLQASYRDRHSKRVSERTLAAAALGDYLKDQPKSLVQLILLADTNQEFSPLLEALRPRLSATVGDFRAVINQSPPPTTLAGTGDWFWKGQANAAVCLMGLNEADAVWPLLKHSRNESLRSFLIDRLARLGADYRILGHRLDGETEPSIRQAVILALGEYDARKFSSVDRRELVAKFTSLYRDDPDAGVHSAAGWALKRYGMEQALGKLDAELRSKGADGKAGSRQWFTNSKGLTFLVVDGPVEFTTTTSAKSFVGFPEKKVRIGYRFALATTEVTTEQLEEYENRPKSFKIPAGTEFNNWTESLVTKYAAPEPNCPAIHVSWYRAAAYCNWLSKQEGIPKNQWCYEANERHSFGDGMKIPADFLRRTGYRLPTQLEWEYALRANTHTAYPFGDPDELLDRYVWYAANSNRRAWPVALLKPNTFGMFDMLGNATEWCQDRAEWQTKQSPPGQIDVIRDDQIRTQQGGSFMDVILSTRYAAPKTVGFQEGFRPARTLP